MKPSSMRADALRPANGVAEGRNDADAQHVLPLADVLEELGARQAVDRAFGDAALADRLRKWKHTGTLVDGPRVALGARLQNKRQYTVSTYFEHGSGVWGGGMAVRTGGGGARSGSKMCT